MVYSISSGRIYVYVFSLRGHYVWFFIQILGVILLVSTRALMRNLFGVITWSRGRRTWSLSYQLFPSILYVLPRSPFIVLMARRVLGA
jgi:hypothetical protein